MGARTFSLALLLTCSACPKPAPPDLPPSALGNTSEGVTMVPDPFGELYALFLRRTIPTGPKAAMWAQYHNKWVRWSGRVVAHTTHGVLLKHLEVTVTFDVSLNIEDKDRPLARQRAPVGHLVTYLGRLESFDDIFRTFYLGHGVIVEDHGFSDGGWDSW